MANRPPRLVKFVSADVEQLTDDRCRAEVLDYREVRGEPFDKIVSVGMVEHVGIANLPAYFDHLRDLLRPVAKRHRTTVSAVAVAWTLAWPGVTGAIVGARSPEQVDGWIGAASLVLEPADLDEITRAIERTKAGAGPRRPTQLPAAPPRATGGFRPRTRSRPE